MSLWTLSHQRADEAAAALVRAFADGDPLVAYLAPDPNERRTVSEMLPARSIESGLSTGRVHVWGDPIVGVAVWLPRPAVDETPGRRPAGPGIFDELDPGVAERARRFAEVQQRLRAIARPDPHVYLDVVGVVPRLRRRGIATALLDAGHAWADQLGLPCALEATTDANVAFYEHRCYEVMARDRVPGSELHITVMRHPMP